MKEDNDKQSFEDGKKYDLLIQTLEQDFLESPRTKEKMQELKKQLSSEKRYILTNQKKIDNLNDAFESLFDEKTKYKNKVLCLIRELLLGYIQKFLHDDYTETLFDGDYFDNEINKLNNLKGRNILQNLRKKTAEIYQDSEPQYYFIDKNNKQFHSICEIEEVDEFVKNIIKRHHLYKTIKDIFDKEDDIIDYSKMVDPNDNKRTFFTKIRPYVKDQTYLNKIDKITGKDNSELPENKK
ncbi:6896_t:CDS:1 [Cetraspora pellucida]|uniref:6896_t:CDS:1 n=1 Tax=Cetraspora pellucida TaxID=1433469 RepID=A0A9N8YZ32_9GLOM|nr:6896_t:CDS:1 [Cetraspora pellucida]